MPVYLPNHAQIIRLAYDDDSTLAGISHDYRDPIVFEKLQFQNAFRLNEDAKPGGVFKIPPV